MQTGGATGANSGTDPKFIFSWELDQALIRIVESLSLQNEDSSSKKGHKRWEEVARLFPGSSAKGVHQRWLEIRNNPGLEYATMSYIHNKLNPRPAMPSEIKDVDSFLMPDVAQIDQLTGVVSVAGTMGNNDSATAPRFTATRSSTVGELRSAALASQHTPVFAFGIKAQMQQSKQQEADGGQEGEYSYDLSRSDVPSIVIHVCDEARGVDKDFKCRKDVLLSEMAYFRSYITQDENCDDIDISVHCDIQIFEWLVNYLHNPKSPPKLDSHNVISILISSQFLKMSRLVNLCIDFVRDHINDIIKLPVDLNCLNSELLKKLARSLAVDQLDAIVDKKDKLQSKLFMKKLEEMLERDELLLHKCQVCKQLFTDPQRKCIPCPNAKIFIDYHGNVLAEHVAHASWDMNRYLLALRSRMTWREVFWRIWGMVHTMECTECHRFFPVSMLKHCSYHPQNPTFKANDNSGIYPCCGAPAIRFDAARVASNSGCHAKMHQVSDPQGLQLMEVVSSRQDLITLPFQANESPRALHLSASGSDTDDSMASEDVDAASTADSLSDSDQDVDRPAHSTFASKGKVRRKRKGGIMKSLPMTASEQDKRQLRLDNLRDEDYKRIRDMQAALIAMRASSPATLNSNSQAGGNSAANPANGKAPHQQNPKGNNRQSARSAALMKAYSKRPATAATGITRRGARSAK